MNLSQQKMPLTIAIISLISACISLYQGFPARTIVPGIGLSLSYLVLNAVWVRDSLARAMGLLFGLALAGLWHACHSFHLPFSQAVFSAIPLLIVMAFNFFWVQRSCTRARASLANWAAANGGQLLEFKHRFSTGPFGGWRGRTDLYFQFVVADRQQQPHMGWAHFDCGLFSNGQYQIKWIENV